MFTKQFYTLLVWVFGLSLMIFSLILFFSPSGFNSNILKDNSFVRNPINIWDFRTIDTMKYSRDYAREKRNDQSFRDEIDKQMENIAKTGANYVGIATPYDEEFLPYLTDWVTSARKHGLKVWFRGNWSSWEGWFEYPHQMTFDQHIAKSLEFVEKNRSLFINGDKFTACPECENGIQGDPRETGRVDEYRRFLIEETNVLKDKFLSMGLIVDTNLLSMNMDVARIVMDRNTAQALGGVIVIDHYVADPTDLATDAKELANTTGASIIYGEFGAPIPDINGDMTDQEQAEWLDKALFEVSKTPEIIGVSYWVNKDGSTEIWESDNTAKPAVEVLTKYFKIKY